jgi:hypothetical protein
MAQHPRRCIRDLVAFTTLPAVWAGREPQAIAESSPRNLHTLRLDIVWLNEYWISPMGRNSPQPAANNQRKTAGTCALGYCSRSAISIPTGGVTVLPVHSHRIRACGGGLATTDFLPSLDRLYQRSNW